MTAVFLHRMKTLQGTGWTAYMLAVARTDAFEKNAKCRDNIAILDILTSIYADHNDDFSVMKHVTLPNALDMTAMGKFE